MSHEPPHFDGKTWEQCQLYVAEELARGANNVHALRGDINAYNLRVEDQRQEDLRRTENDNRAFLGRMAIVETKLLLFGAMGGLIGGAIATGIFQLIMKH